MKVSQSHLQTAGEGPLNGPVSSIWAKTLANTVFARDITRDTRHRRHSMRSTMQDYQLTIRWLARHGGTVHADSEIVTATADGSRRQSYAQTGERIAQLANGLRSLGIDGDQRVATFQWNNAEHMESYLAIPAMGAVLHTLNIRLFPEDLVYVAN